MVVGYDVFHKRGKKSQLAYCGTVSRNFTRYWSKTLEMTAETQEMVTQLDDLVTESCEAFKELNKVYPK